MMQVLRKQTLESLIEIVVLDTRYFGILPSQCSSFEAVLAKGSLVSSCFVEYWSLPLSVDYDDVFGDVEEVLCFFFFKYERTKPGPCMNELHLRAAVN